MCRRPQPTPSVSSVTYIPVRVGVCIIGFPSLQVCVCVCFMRVVLESGYGTSHAASHRHPLAGALDSELAEDIRTCNPDGELCVYITKLYPSDDVQHFDAFGRVMSGTIAQRSSVRVRPSTQVGQRGG